MFKKLRDNEFLCIWVIWNGLFLALLTVLTVLGWTIPIINADKTFLSHVIVGVFLIGWGFSVNRAIWIVQAHRNIETFRRTYKTHAVNSRDDARESIQTFLSEKLSVLEYLPRVLVNLGLVGTVVGIMIGVSGVSADMVNDLSKATEALNIMLHGLGIGFTATLIGSAGALWIQFQEEMIKNEYSRLYRRILE